MSEVKSHNRSLVVFVHGFSSSADCWTKLRELLEKYPRDVPHFDLAFFSYKTKRVVIIERLPSLSEVANELAGFIENETPRGYCNITLVGHSMGGLVIQTYIEAKLKEGRGDDLARLRQVILFASPNLGSLTLDTTRRLIGFIAPNPQEEKLRVFDLNISSLQTQMAENVVDATRYAPNQAPIPFICFYGDDDKIVPEPSVRGRFDNVLKLPGDHSSIIRPTERDDPRYTQFVAYLLEPAGHRNFFEVEEWGVSVRVEPRDVTVPVVAVHGGEKRDVFTDNYARLTRTVKFSRRNRCRAQFELSYKTRGGGWVAYTTSHPNDIGPQVQRDYDDDGFNACFKFTPRVADDDDGHAAGAGELFRLDVDIYKGFDEGERNLHFHLADYASIYHKIFFRLDLSAYLSVGYDVTDEPKLYLHDGPNTCGACGDRELGEEWPAKTRDPRGVWEWEINRARDGEVIRDGIVDVKWDVAKKSWIERLISRLTN